MRVYHLEPDPVRATFRVVPVEERPWIANGWDARYALAVLRIYARLDPGHRLSEREIHAARTALARLGLGWE